MFKVGTEIRDTEFMDLVKEIESPSKLKVKFGSKSVKGLIKEVHKNGTYELVEDKIRLNIGLRIITLPIKRFEFESNKPSKEELILKELEVF